MSKDNEVDKAAKQAKNEEKLFEKLVQLKRVTKVVKGGRRFSFSALAVVGDRNGSVGLGFGKAKDVSDTIRKAIDKAKKNMVKVHILKETLPHEITIKYKATKIILKPATRGTGIIASNSIRPIMEGIGVNNVLSKIIGSSNPSNVAKATMKALTSFTSAYDLAALRGKDIQDFWS